MNFRTLVRRRYAIALPLVMLTSLATDVPAQTFNCNPDPSDIVALRTWAAGQQFSRIDGTFDRAILDHDNRPGVGPIAYVWPAVNIHDPYTPNVARVVAEVELTGDDYPRLGLPEGKSWIALCQIPHGSTVIYRALIIPENSGLATRAVVRHQRPVPKYAIVDWRHIPGSWALCFPCVIFGWCEL